MNAALEHANRQRHYDRLHHLMRIEWLESLPKLDHLNTTLLRQSRDCAADASGMHGWGSVDLEDASYLAELDSFAESRRAA